MKSPLNLPEAQIDLAKIPVFTDCLDTIVVGCQHDCGKVTSFLGLLGKFGRQSVESAKSGMKVDSKELQEKAVIFSQLQALYPGLKEDTARGFCIDMHDGIAAILKGPDELKQGAVPEGGSGYRFISLNPKDPNSSLEQLAETVLGLMGDDASSAVERETANRAAKALVGHEGEDEISAREELSSAVFFTLPAPFNKSFQEILRDFANHSGEDSGLVNNNLGHGYDQDETHQAERNKFAIALYPLFLKNGVVTQDEILQALVPIFPNLGKIMTARENLNVKLNQEQASNEGRIQNIVHVESEKLQQTYPALHWDRIENAMVDAMRDEYARQHNELNDKTIDVWTFTQAFNALKVCMGTKRALLEQSDFAHVLVDKLSESVTISALESAQGPIAVADEELMYDWYASNMRLSGLPYYFFDLQQSVRINDADSFALSLQNLLISDTPITEDSVRTMFQAGVTNANIGDVAAFNTNKQEIVENTRAEYLSGIAQVKKALLQGVPDSGASVIHTAIAAGRAEANAILKEHDTSFSIAHFAQALEKMRSFYQESKRNHPNEFSQAFTSNSLSRSIQEAMMVAGPAVFSLERKQ